MGWDKWAEDLFFRLTCVGPAGLEPAASAMWTQRSDQLSYEPKIDSWIVPIKQRKFNRCQCVKQGSETVISSSFEKYEIVNDFLVIKWDNGEESYTSFEILRNNCPCAECSGETDALGNLYVGSGNPKSEVCLLYTSDAADE